LIDPRQTGLIDYILMAVCCGLAIYSTAISLNLGQIGLVYCGLLVLGTAGAFAISRLKPGHWVLKLDWLFYLVFGLVAVSCTSQLNFFLGDDPFQGTVYAAGAMIWLMILGSFATWRNGTLLFQTVPSLALFSLVGCWDLFGGSIYLFFIYLLCFAGLMGRVNARLMVDLAGASGYSQFHRLREGVWRWVAGPEWALGSAAIVILVSLLGAPIVQQIAEPISGRFRTNAFKPVPHVDSPPGVSATEGDYKVGNGPLSLSDQEAFVFSAKKPDYLRCCEYFEFRDGIWKAPIVANDGDIERSDRAAQALAAQTTDTYAISSATPDQRLPIVGVLRSFSPASEVLTLPDSEHVMVETTRPIEVFYSPNQGAVLRDAGPAPYQSTGNWMPSPRLIDFIGRSTAKATSDYERAIMLRDAIAKQAKYNLKAPAIPSGKDPVDYFLFESRQGYCDLFATSMVLCAREVGIPARYAVGYLPDTDAGPSSLFPGLENFTVRQRDAHAWAELFFKGAGWVVFDATQDATEVTGGERGSANARTLDVGLLFRGLGVLLVLGLAALAQVTLSRFRKKTPSSSRSIAGRAGLGFEAILLRAVGRPRRLSETFSEYLEQGRLGLGRLYPDALDLNQRFERALFGEAEPSAEEVDALKREVARLKAATKKKQDHRSGAYLK